MELRNFSFIFYFILIIGSIPNSNGESLLKFQKAKTTRGNTENNDSKNFRELQEYDTYITLYFKEDCYYPYGFAYYYYRNTISSIKNTQDDSTFSGYDSLTINKDYAIEIHFGQQVTDLNYFFSSNNDGNMVYLVSIDFSNFDSSSLYYINGIFSGCSSLQSIDFTNFNTTSVTSMSSMFSGCTSLKSIYLKTFDTSNLIYMNSLFYNCISLTSIDMSYSDISKVTEMQEMFYG